MRHKSSVARTGRPAVRSFTAGAIAAIGMTIVLGVLCASAFASVVVYDNIPSPQPGNVPSVGFEATSSSEFGGQVGLAGSAREDPTITVLMSSWACEEGSWTSGCVTAEGSTFAHPVTLNVYEVGPGDSVGGLIATATSTFTMPFRPSSDGCGGDPTAWYDAGEEACNHGLAFPISFDLPGVTLPDDVIIGVAYDTSHYGADPIGATGPYDSLNVGTNGGPTVGSPLPTPDDAYLNSSWSGAYCPPDTTTGTFRLDPGCWTGYLPALEVEASKDHPLSKDECKQGGWQEFDSPSFRNQGDCVSWVEHNVNGHGHGAG